MRKSKQSETKKLRVKHIEEGSVENGRNLRSPLKSWRLLTPMPQRPGDEKARQKRAQERFDLRHKGMNKWAQT
eukprot:UN07470